MTNQGIPFHQRDAWMAPGGRDRLLLRVLTGLLAGVAGGILYGLLVPPANGLGQHLAIYALLGVVFGWAFGDSVHWAGAGLVWGQAFGLLWWVLGTLTAIPLVSGQGLHWSIEDVQTVLPQLLGQIAAYGAVLGYSYHWLARWLAKRLPPFAAGAALPALRPRPTAHTIVPHWVRACIVGGLGGLLGSWVFVWGLVGTDFYAVVASIGRSDSIAVGRTLHYLIGLIIGVSFGLLFNHEDQDPGSGILYGINYGLFWWIIGPMILLPWLLGRDARPYWTLATVQSVVPSFVGHILYGALVGWFYGVVNQLWRVLFVDSDPLNRMVEGVGPRGLRALLMGQAGGILGGLLFTIVIVGVGALPRVASLIGMESPVAGFIVHLVISVIIGSSYGLLFYRKASSYAAELALGLVYGWFWWVLGAVTLFALLLRQPVDWSLPAVTSLYPSLIGHLLYGAGLAIFFQFLTRRYDAVALRRIRRIPQPIDTAAPAEQAQPTAAAVWVVILVLGVVLPLLMWTESRVQDGGY